MSKRVFIGVGHGGRDPGAIGSAQFGSVVEKNANLTVALAMKEALELNGFVVGISRIDDRDDGMTDEVTACKKFGADLAVEVHTNAGGGDGFEVWAQLYRFKEQSHAAAKAIEARVKEMGQQSRGVKTKVNSHGNADYYGWLRLNDCPAVLCEGFFVDSKDALDFADKDGLKLLGYAYALGVMDYFGVACKYPDTPVTATDEPTTAPVVTPELDNTPAEWAREGVDWAVKNGLMVGDGTGNLCLHQSITREQFCVMLKRYHDKAAQLG